MYVPQALKKMRIMLLLGGVLYKCDYILLIDGVVMFLYILVDLV